MKGSDWIKVSDRLPEDEQRVLIAYQPNSPNRPWDDVQVDMIRYYADFTIDLFTPCPGWYKVTHWMPIELPEEE